MVSRSSDRRRPSQWPSWTALRRATTLLRAAVPLLTLAACERSVTEPSLAPSPRAAFATNASEEPKRWSEYSDSALFAIASARDSLYAVGLKAAASKEGMTRGKVQMTKGEWRAAIAVVQKRPGVTVTHVDSVRVPYMVVKIVDTTVMSQLRRLPVVEYLEPAKMAATSFMSGDCTYGSGSVAVSSGGQNVYSGSLTPVATSWGYYDYVSDEFVTMAIPNAWNMSRGDGVLVGITDTGMDSEGDSEWSPSYASSGMSAGRSVTNSSLWANTTPSCSHGTRIAGLVGAPRNGRSTVGAAYRANIVSIYQADGEHPDAMNASMAIDAAAGIYGAKIVVMAWGEMQWYSSIANYIYYYYINQDVLFIGAAGTCFLGNSWCPRMDSAVFPAEMEEVLAVSGANSDGSRPVTMYNYGNKSGVLAYTNLATTGMRMSQIVTIGGSSGATGVVAGIAALVRARNPSLTNRQVMDRIMKTSGSQCGAPAVWRESMVNASAAVGGPCVQRLRADLAYYINDPWVPNRINSYSAFVAKSYTSGFAAGGSGVYDVQWITGPGAIPVSTSQDEISDFGNIYKRYTQQLRFRASLEWFREA